MNNQKIDVGRIVLLSLLVLGLAASVTYMFRTIGAQSPARRRAAAEQTADTPAYDKTKPASSTNMPPVPGSQGKQISPSGTKEVKMGANESMFKVYGLKPEGNPFVRREEWYSEELADLPGYPQIRESGYLESMESTVPLSLLNEFPGDPEWEKVVVTKQHMPNTYSIQGTSEDGLIRTSIEATAVTPDPVDITWEGASGIPLSELGVPGWEERYGAEQLAPANIPASAPGESDTAQSDSSLPPLPDLSNGATGIGGGLPAPGDVMNGAGSGDFLAVQGINLQDGHKSALVFYNGQHYIVSEGSVLPTHYQVLSINSDGVVLLELRDGSSRFVPLAAMRQPETKR